MWRGRRSRDDTTETHSPTLLFPLTSYVIFDWDNLFLAYMASLEEESLDIAFSNLMQIALARTQDGFVPNFASAFHVSNDRTEPQIGAYVALQIYEKWGADRAGFVVDTILDALLGWVDWSWRMRRGEGSLAGPDGRADLLVLGSDDNDAPGGVVGGEGTLQAARYESGLDNSRAFAGARSSYPSAATTHNLPRPRIFHPALHSHVRRRRPVLRQRRVPPGVGARVLQQDDGAHEPVRRGHDGPLPERHAGAYCARDGARAHGRAADAAGAL